MSVRETWSTAGTMHSGQSAGGSVSASVSLITRRIDVDLCDKERLQKRGIVEKFRRFEFRQLGEIIPTTHRHGRFKMPMILKYDYFFGIHRSP